MASGQEGGNGVWLTDFDADYTCAGDSRGGRYESADCCVGQYTIPASVQACPLDVRLLPRHTIWGVVLQMNINAWEYYLQFEEDDVTQGFLRDGILNMFSIVDVGDKIDLYHCKNYSSAVT